MAGLHRSVHLRADGPVHLADVRVDAGLADDDLTTGTLRVRATRRPAGRRGARAGLAGAGPPRAARRPRRAAPRCSRPTCPTCSARTASPGYVADASRDRASDPAVVGRGPAALPACSCRSSIRTARCARSSPRPSASAGSRWRGGQLLVNGRADHDPRRQPPRPPPRPGQGRHRGRHAGRPPDDEAPQHRRRPLLALPERPALPRPVRRARPLRGRRSRHRVPRPQRLALP